MGLDFKNDFPGYGEIRQSIFLLWDFCSFVRYSDDLRLFSLILMDLLFH